MKNQYLFINEEKFDEIDLSEYHISDREIPGVNVHICSIELKEADNQFTDDYKAQKLDEVSERLKDYYSDGFTTISSESSQYFCKELYPLIAEFENKFRYALYISRALYTKEPLTIESFRIKTASKGIKLQSFEDLEFFESYKYFFTDPDVIDKVKHMNNSILTKDDIIKYVNSIEENIIWHDWVGTKYKFIEEHFHEIKGYRNDVMHNHLINHERYTGAVDILKEANAELDQIINDKLLANKSKYANNQNIFDSLGSAIKTGETVASAINSIDRETITNNLQLILSAFSKLSKVLNEVPEKELLEAAKSEE